MKEIIIILFCVVIIIWTLIGFRYNYIKSNEEYDKTKKMMKAKIVSYSNHRDTSGYTDPGETPLSKMTYFKGESKSFSNVAQVEIIETGEIVNCTFGKIVSEKNYPIGKIIDVYYSKGKDKYDVRSIDHPELFKKARKKKQYK